MEKKIIWLAIFLVVLVWSGIYPKDQLTWFLEVLPALIGVVVLIISRKNFRLTPLLYIFILGHSIILMVGGHYTYSEVPLFDYFKEWFGFERNNYDKLGHLAQGFVPALIAREIIIRKNIIPFPFWQCFFIVCFCLALSAFYELIEWWVAIAVGGDAEAFLATQGDIWDTQSDMGLALLGAILSLLTLSKLHDRQLNRLQH